MLMFTLSISCLTTSNLPSSRTTWLNFVLHFSPLEWKGHLFWVLVLEGLLVLHRTVQLLQHYWSGHRLGLPWYWIVCLGNKQRPFWHFWDCTQVLHFGLTVDCEGYSISLKEFLLGLLLLLLLSHFSRVRLCATPSLGFSRQEHWSGLPFPSPMHKSEKWKWSRSAMSDSSQPHGLQPTRLLHPWDFPGKCTGVECHCLLRLLSLAYLKCSQNSYVSLQLVKNNLTEHIL